MEIPEQTNGQFHGIDTQKPWAFFDGSFKTMIRETWYKSLEALHKKINILNPLSIWRL